MLTSTESIEGEQVCSECNDDLGNDFAKLAPCHHYACFRCLSRLLAEKLPTDALACPSCSENVTGHTECRRDDDDCDVANVLKRVKHSAPPQVLRSPDGGGDDEASEGRKVTSSPRRLRRTKSKMRVLKSLSEDEQPLKQIHEDDDHSESTDGKNKRDSADRRADKTSSSKSTRSSENQHDRGSGDEERLNRSRESGNTTSSGSRPSSSRPNARSLRASSSRRLSPDKPSQNRSQSRDNSDHVDDKKQPRRRSKSLSSSRHGQLRTKSSITNSEHGGDGRSMRRTSSGEDSAHSTASKLSSRSNDKHQRSRRGPSRQADPPAQATQDDDSSNSSDPARVGKVNDDGDRTASESDSNRAKEVIANSPTKPESSPEENGAGPEKGRKLVTQMKAIAKLAMLGRGLAQSPRKPMKSQKGISLNNDNDDSEQGLAA